MEESLKSAPSSLVTIFFKTTLTCLIPHDSLFMWKPKASISPSSPLSPNCSIRGSNSQSFLQFPSNHEVISSFLSFSCQVLKLLPLLSCPFLPISKVPIVLLAIPLRIYCPTHSLLKADKNVLLKHTSLSFQNFTTPRWLFINIIERQLRGLRFLDFRNCGILMYTVTHIAIQPEHLSSHPRPVENWMRLKISSRLSTEHPIISFL